MACCLLCFDDSPVTDDTTGKYRPGSSTFQLAMDDTLTKNQPVCLVGSICCPCCAYYTRYRALNYDMSKYICCQGYLDCCCFKAGNCGEKSCPTCCLVTESCLCVGPSISSTRLFLMDHYDLQSDPCDNRIIRLTNFLQCFACILDIAAIFLPFLQESAFIVQTIADVVFWSTVGCMVSQVHHEMDYRRHDEVKGGPVARAEGEALLKEEGGKREGAGPDSGDSYQN